jgi:hypothetical protein
VSIVYDVLREELDRLKEKEKAYADQLERLPKGSLVSKKINGREYHYLVYREGRHVKTKFIKAEEVQNVSILVKQRKQFEMALRGIRKDCSHIRKVVKD